MSILKMIDDRERDLVKAVKFYNAEAEYWEKRYWSEKFEEIKHQDAMHHRFIKTLIQGVDAVTKVDSSAHS